MNKSIIMSDLCCHVIVCMNIYFSELQKWLQMAHGTDHGKGDVFRSASLPHCMSHRALCILQGIKHQSSD